jgi:threonyl-tRNA synthetase
LHGLTRVRFVTQDDAHIFCTDEQVPSEIDATIAYARYLYGLFGMEPRPMLSTRPENRFGGDEQWDRAEAALRDALERHEMEFELDEGGGAFYGPKIDLFMDDVLGRAWQTGTIQYDMQMPGRFGLTYMGPDNREHTPIVIHRALYGSFERFIGILIEHYAGAFPFWLAPEQLRIVAVGESHSEPARVLASRARDAGYRVEVDDRDDTVGKKIRDAELQKIPFVVVWGDRESHDALALRVRGGGQRTVSLDDLLHEFSELVPS